ncbi:hypothetical protein J6590_054802 [Homalodisca vitripennis]|nr:hypothetical protein J6590_054802 [Homalodisca vitripennis]
MEKVVTEQIISYIENGKIVSETQSGFRRGFSTCSALLNMVDEVCRARNNKMCSVVAALDYRQAFDSTCVPEQKIDVAVGGQGTSYSAGRHAATAKGSPGEGKEGILVLWTQGIQCPTTCC